MILNRRCRTLSILMVISIALLSAHESDLNAVHQRLMVHKLISSKIQDTLLKMLCPENTILRTNIVIHIFMSLVYFAK
jgi:hypothetical protein